MQSLIKSPERVNFKMMFDFVGEIWTLASFRSDRMGFYCQLWPSRADAVVVCLSPTTAE
jgi:hypothetical protein